jgi:eukaryotic-like serine/threonine-protein kinase
MPIVSEPLGRVLGNRYRLVAALGSGASAHVFLAEDMVLQRRVAVKVLQPALARDDAFLRRFRAEARSVAALNHPHVLRVFDWGEGEDGPYLVLEYLEGGSLLDMLARGRRLSPGQAARIGAQAADGLAYAHARGIVHRDVKPANILFDEDGRVRVADFGVARALSSASTTDPGTMVGTARYASPEQAQGLQLDGRSDVYSLGLVLYEAVTGTVPFTGDTPHATLQARIGETVPDHPALGTLAPALAAACAPEPADRPDAAQFAEGLEGLGDDLLPGGPLPLVRRGPVEDADLGATRVQGLELSPPADDVTLAGASAMAAGFGAVGTFGAGRRRAAGNGMGLVDTGEPTATIKMGAQPVVTSQTLRRRRPPRRWPWVVSLLIVVACILAGGGVYLAKSNLFTASHVVPSVVGDTLTSARQALRADHFKVKVDSAVTSITVASGKVISQSPKEGVSLKEGSTIRILPSSGKPLVSVPTLSSDIDCSVATQLLAVAHLHASCPASSSYSATVPKGDVINWSYNGTAQPKTAPYGSTIQVAVSEGKPPVQIPSFADESYTQAAATLSADGLAVREVETYSTTVGAERVVATTPPAGATVTVGTAITVTVSKGPSEVPVPTVIGDTAAKAEAAIQAAGLTVGSVYGPATGVVFTTDPLAGQKEKIGTPVTLYTEAAPTTGPGPKPGGTTG